MRKKYILTITLMAAMTISGCSKAQVEKEPVIVADNLSVDDNKASSSEDYNINLDNEAELEYQTTDGEKSGDTGTDAEGGLISSSGDDTEAVTAKKPSEKNDQVADPSKESETRKMIIEIEGMQEEINGMVYHSELGYKITYDKDRFTATHTDYGADSIIAENPNPEIYPYVAVYISRSEKPSSDINWLNNSVITVSGSEAAYVDDVQIGHSSAKHYKSVAGKEWNSIINHYYFIEQEKFYFIISTQYFLEAEEGYGARIQAMLDTFEFE